MPDCSMRTASCFINRNGKMYELKDGEGTELTDDENSIPSSAIYCKNGDYEGFVWLQTMMRPAKEA